MSVHLLGLIGLAVLLTVAMISRYRGSATTFSAGADDVHRRQAGSPSATVTGSEELCYEAGYQASLTRSLAIWLLGGTAAILVPFFWTAFGLFLWAGLGTLWLAIPIRLAVWKHRYGSLPIRDEIRQAHQDLRLAQLLWALSPFALVAISLLFHTFISPTLRR